MSNRNPQNWDEYQYGTSHRSSISSTGGRSVRFDPQDNDDTQNDESRGRTGSEHEVRRRRYAKDVGIRNVKAYNH